MGCSIRYEETRAWASTSEARRIFQELTVYENLMMGAYTITDQQKCKTELDKISDRAYVLETGKITFSGTGKELMQSPEVQKAYLGG